MSDNKSRRKASNIIIDAKSQFYLSIPFFILLTSNLIMAVYIGLENSKLVSQIDPSQSEVIALVQANSMKLTTSLLMGSLIFGSLCLVLWLIFSHRILGPMVPIRRHVQKLIEKDYGSKVSLRKGDEFKDLAEDLNKLADALKNSRS